MFISVQNRVLNTENCEINVDLLATESSYYASLFTLTNEHTIANNITSICSDSTDHSRELIL